ncbi:MAG TPA: T9SS type A sorting domain-containing protein, partial [Ignavibacteria bacterium]
ASKIFFVNSNTGWALGSVLMKTITGGITYINQITNQIPEKFSLYQNYPNPFNPTTKIKFDIATLSRGAGGVLTSLKIYDITGREIQTLVNDKLNPGTYEVTFDAGNLPSGIYFYKLITNDFVENKKLVLIK